MIDYKSEHEYAMWNEKTIIADCLRELGFESLASEIHTHAINGDIIESYIHLIQKTATSRKNNDVLDRLCFAGLIYG